ncbi:MAG: 4'-phosphopantetheinyl transferase superfamily protein [Balneolaceae bacterium]|nr:4'-phosphopantetheinyl transferase superfamily protein [Balneolaceae bacterium]
MELINTTDITGWPEGVLLGYSPLKEGLSTHILSPDEKKEYQTFSNAQRKQEFLSARYLLRMLIEELDIEYGVLELKKEEKGKPYVLLDEQKVYVSFSHSKELVMAAISEQKDIGLDIETTDRVIDHRIVERILNEDEWEVAGEEDPIKLWTIKEAAVKSLGTGLRTNLRDLTIKKIKKNEYSIRFNDDKSFEICNFEELNHQIALAY